MTELVEYTLVVMVSTLFVAGSAFVYNSFTGFEASLQLKAAFDAVSGTAIQAVEGGTGSAAIWLLRRDCLGVWLVSYSFQAPGFYRKQGYDVAATIDCDPPGLTRYYMTKRLR
jgi:hypothetical protein